MTVAAVMMVKDEADVIEHTLRHLRSQVDRVFVSDNASTDGTREILHDLAFESAEAWLEVSDDPDPAYYQAEKTTRLADVAGGLGYDWVVPCDADEVWLSPHGRVGDVLDGLAASAATIVEAVMWNHVATSVDPAAASPFLRMGYRLRDPGALPKVAVRTGPGLRIEMGNHGVRYEGTWGHRPVVVKELLQIRHFPYRSADHFVRKAVNGYAAYRAAGPELAEFGGHWRGYGRMIEQHGEDAARDWFRAHFFYPDPIEDPRLVYDPAPVAQ